MEFEIIERKLEAQERRERRNNVIIRGLAKGKGRETESPSNNARKETEKFLCERLEVQCKG